MSKDASRDVNTDGDSLEQTIDGIENSARKIARNITGEKFDAWYREHQWAENIRAGQPYFNGPSQLKPPGKFTASELSKCHRKTYYKHLNAPQETDDPDGIFYFGSIFEEDLVERFIEEAVCSDDFYLRNSLWINYEISTSLGDVKLTGSTDPVIVDAEGAPILLTEIKTSSSVQYRTEPQESHKAQAHAYMVGLSEEWEREVDEAVILYAGRKSLDVTTFRVQFDKEFWQDIIRWMKTNTYYRTFGQLPPAEPEQDWECDYCAYKNRCGKGEDFYGDEEAAGFLPLLEYPKEKVEEYLEAHDAAKLTPALAYQHSDLAEEYEVFDWSCDACGATLDWREQNYTIDGSPPKCPACGPDSTNYLSGPAPAEQHHIEVVDRPSEAGE